MYFDFKFWIKVMVLFVFELVVIFVFDIYWYLFLIIFKF